MWDLAERRSPDKARLAELSPEGELRITDLITGQVTPPVQIPRPVNLEYFDLVDDTLWVDDFDHVVSYDIHTGRQLSRILAPNGGIACGEDLFCMDDFQGDGQLTLRIVRASTGKPVLNLPNAVATGAMGTRLLVQGDFRQPARDTSIVDLAGDRTPRPLTPWQSARAIDDHRVLAVAHALAAGEATIAIVDIDTRHATIIGRMGDWFVPPECHRYGAYVLCISSGAWAVWRLPPVQ
jgi:hypothetical protein